MDTLLPIVFVLLMLSCGVGIVLQSIFLSKLRSKHPRTWETLGRPTLFLNNSIANGIAVLRFLWRREYRSLEDDGFAQFAGFLRFYLAAYFVLFVIASLAFIAMVVPNWF